MYSLGLDFGTNSVRSVILDLEKGVETADAACPYPSGCEGIILDEKDPHSARQHPRDYHITLDKVIKSVVKKAKRDKNFVPEKVIGIGVDTTGSTPLPVDERMAPLAFQPRFKSNRNAMAFLWKDHTAVEEAEEITFLAQKIRPEYLLKTGGVYSSEWFFAKLLYLARKDRRVFDSMAGFIELCDYIPALLSGAPGPESAVRSVCAAGHKAIYSPDWGGLPDEEFFCALDGSFRGLKAKLYEKAFPAGMRAGCLCPEWAEKTGLPAGIPVSVGAFDAHIGAVAAGVKPGIVVKVIGTSSCDITVAEKGEGLRDIPGICGVVPDSVIPGFTGIEAGQSAVGDIFGWFVKKFSPSLSPETAHKKYMKAAAKLKPGESGLLALDWHNGNRNILVDEHLTGLVAGFTLNTRPEEVYRALMEATCFGGRAIIERIEEYGVDISGIIATGGIPEKNPLLMQIYSDITGVPFKITDFSQGCAVGASVFGAIAAGKAEGGFRDVAEARRKICRFKKNVYRPNKKNREIYNRLYRIYKDVCGAFGDKEREKGLYSVMKELLKIKGLYKS